jgi:hypothetical protein
LENIAVRDLLTFRMGFGAIMVPSAAYPIRKAVNDLQMRYADMPW